MLFPLTFFFLMAIQATHIAEELVSDSHKQMKEEGGVAYSCRRGVYTSRAENQGPQYQVDRGKQRQKECRGSSGGGREASK